VAPGGYGWVFPKGNHLNIGVIGWQHFGPSLRQRLDTLTRYYGFDPATLWGVRGYRLPIRQPGAPLADGNVILTGDAAGLVDPFSGEGIYTAVWSGKLAAEHLAAYAAGQTRDLAGYQHVVEQEIGQELRIASRIYDLFYWSPMVSMQAIRRVPGVWSALARLVRGDRTYAGLRRQIGPLARGLAVASTLIRGTPRWRYLTGRQASPRP
jgi:flavin-dependent dehydrogenase